MFLLQPVVSYTSQKAFHQPMAKGPEARRRHVYAQKIIHMQFSTQTGIKRGQAMRIRAALYDNI